MYVDITLKIFNNIPIGSIRRLKSSIPRMAQVFTQMKNPLTGATEWGIQREDYDYHQEIARSAFADMLHDTERNRKYQRAIKLAIDRMHASGKEANVLDIGTGTGLLSIMAAKLGADSIVACEAFKPMAECCIKILEHNGVAGKIKVVSKSSLDLTVGEEGDLPKKANILVTEVFDTELIGEGALPTFMHAHENLLEKDCIVVPDSAVVYAQVVECPRLQRWNKLQDVGDNDGNLVLKTPEKMRDCLGSAAVHDIQLSQLPRRAFRELSEQIPVFSFDWSGRVPLVTCREEKQDFTATNTGKAQVVFMWWELNMDRDGKIVLSCAPWWCHPDAVVEAKRPQDTIPWRDHWMQAVYYLPYELSIVKGAKMTLISCHDEFSLWFYLQQAKVEIQETEDTNNDTYLRPFCDCGVHMSFSRTHVSYLNDGNRSRMFIAKLKEEMSDKAVVLDLNGSSLMGIAAATMGAQVIYFLESMKLIIGIITDYARENNVLNKITFMSGVQDELLATVTHVICDPNFSRTILPWENLRMAYILYKYKSKLRPNVRVIPEMCEIWGMPVEFQHLHKIRIPLKKCEGIDMMVFDKLIEKSRSISDAELEPQPLWEYPCKCRGTPQRLLRINMNNLQPRYAANATYPILEKTTQDEHPVNGFVVWATWNVGSSQASAGPLEEPRLGHFVEWDPHSRQAVKILDKTYYVTQAHKWNYIVACDLEKAQFNICVDITKEKISIALLIWYVISALPCSPNTSGVSVSGTGELTTPVTKYTSSK